MVQYKWGELYANCIRIKTLRNELKWSQETLAKKCSIGRSSLANYEQGIRRPDYDVVEKIACALNVTPQFLLGWEDENGNVYQDTFNDPNYINSFVSDEDREFVKWIM